MSESLLPTNQEFLASLLDKLKKPIPYQWRVQSFTKKGDKCTCVAYIDARQLMDALDEHAVYGWGNEYKEVKGNLFCGISIIMPDGTSVTRWDVGTEGNFEAEKSAASDAFKRSGVKWGVGRFLYDLEILTIDAKTTQYNGRDYSFPVDKHGDRIYDLTKYISENILSMPQKENGIHTQQEETSSDSQSPLDEAIAKIGTHKTKKEAVEWAKTLEDSIRVNKEFRKAFSQKFS